MQLSLSSPLAFTVDCGQISPLTSSPSHRRPLSPVLFACPKSEHGFQFTDSKIPRSPEKIATASWRWRQYSGRNTRSPPKEGVIDTEDATVSTQSSAMHKQLLEQLAADRRSYNSTSSQDTALYRPEHVLYRRISDMRAQDRRGAVESIMYSLVEDKFKQAGLVMLPSIDGNMQFQQRISQLEAVHAKEVGDMVKQHVRRVLIGGNGRQTDREAMLQVLRQRMGEIYAASAMYGYFLRRVYESYKLEMVCGTLGDDGDTVQGGVEGYVKSFDEESLRRKAKLKSEESVDTIEMRAQALFGKPPQPSPYLTLTWVVVRLLVLEAMAFGTFLWDSETFVDSHYEL